MNQISTKDIVIIRVPFTDLTETKLRPALVLGIAGEDLICVFISSKISMERPKGDVLLKKDAHNKLRVDSVVKCHKIFTLHESLVERILGQTSGKNHQQVLRVISGILGL